MQHPKPQTRARAGEKINPQNSGIGGFVVATLVGLGVIYAIVYTPGRPQRRAGHSYYF